MTQRLFAGFIVLILLSFKLPAETDVPWRLDFQQSRVAIKGDAQGLNYLESCAGEHYVCAMLVYVARR